MTVEEARGWLERVGYTTKVDRDDKGLIRVLRGDRLVGMVVVRDDPAGRGLVVTYAEVAGRVFPFWRTEPYGTTLDRLRDWIRTHPAR